MNQKLKDLYISLLSRDDKRQGKHYILKYNVLGQLYIEYYVRNAARIPGGAYITTLGYYKTSFKLWPSNLWHRFEY